ncbi:MAG: hypothetical protein RIS08_130 [Actinomycetota bacterium]|jgi:hypothetical protein
MGGDLKKSRFARGALALVLLYTLLIPTSSAALQDSFAQPIPGHRTVTLVGMNVETTTESRLWHHFFTLGQGAVSVEVKPSCRAVGSSDCPLELRPNLFSSFFFQAVLPLCDSENAGFCVEGLEIFSSNSSNSQRATFLGSADGASFPAQHEFDLPEGGTPLIFSAPSFPHSGGDTTYAVVASLNGQCSQPTFRCVHNELQLAVQPFSARSGVLNYRGGERFDFSEGTRIKLGLQVPKSIGGWFTGRVGDPTLSVSSLDAVNSSMRIQIEASSLKINRLSANVPDNVVTPQMAALQMPPGINAGIESGFSTALDWVEELRPFVQDVASGSVNVWQLKSVFLPDKSCYPPGRLHGLVTTNSVAYSWNPPEFKDGFLQYRVAGLHLNKDKSLAKGTYDLIISSETARCLYGFSKAPVSATVQVIGDQGVENIATTIVSEKDGWIKLAAYGFTFSKKEIQVRLTQPFSLTLTKFSRLSKTLSSRQKSEIKAVVSKGTGNPLFVCTGTYISESSRALALARAKAACSYAKMLDKDHTFEFGSRQSSLRTEDSRVTITSK